MNLDILKKLSNEDIILLKRGSKYPLSVFRLLGYITSFYAGSLNLEKGIIESIFTYDFEENNGSHKIKQIEKICLKVIEETDLNNDLNITIKCDDFNKSTTYILSSPNICNYMLPIIKTKDLLSLFIPTMKPIIGLFPLALLQRFEFLVGTYLSHQTDIEGEWRFENNLQKFKTVFEFLYVFVDDEDTIQTTSFFRTPHIHKIKLNIDGELWSTIKENI